MTIEAHTKGYQARTIDGGDDCELGIVINDTEGLPVRISLFTEGLNEDQITHNDSGQWISREAAVELGQMLLAAGGKQTPVAATQVEADVNLSLLRVAEAHGLTVEFGYSTLKNSGIIQNRTMQVDEVVEARSGFLVIGHDLDREDIRAFRLDGIIGQVRVK